MSRDTTTDRAARRTAALAKRRAERKLLPAKYAAEREAARAEQERQREQPAGAPVQREQQARRVRLLTAWAVSALATCGLAADGRDEERRRR